MQASPTATRLPSLGAFSTMSSLPPFTVASPGDRDPTAPMGHGAFRGRPRFCAHLQPVEGRADVFLPQRAKILNKTSRASTSSGGADRRRSYTALIRAALPQSRSLSFRLIPNEFSGSGRNNPVRIGVAGKEVVAKSLFGKIAGKGESRLKVGGWPSPFRGDPQRLTAPFCRGILRRLRGNQQDTG